MNEWTAVDKLSQSLREAFDSPPETAIVLGSGLGQMVDQLEARQTIETASLVAWPNSTVEGHAGKLHLGKLGERRVLLVQGRVHLYEGYTPHEVVRSVRALSTWGTDQFFLTNASGGIRPDLNAGQLMLVTDHLNLTGRSPLIGPEGALRGPRFPDLSHVYDRPIREQVLASAKELGITLAQGVYAGMLGPTYETPAEVRMLERLGADAVGMSTVLEATALQHLGAKVAAVSCITNRAAGLEGAVLDHTHVQRAGEAASNQLGQLIMSTLAKTGERKA